MLDWAMPTFLDRGHRETTLPPPPREGHVVGVGCHLLSEGAVLTGWSNSASAIRTAPTASAAVATKPPAAAAAEAGHLGEARIDLLLGLLEDIDKIPGLLGVCDGLTSTVQERGRGQS